AIASGDLTLSELDEHVGRILKVKEWTGASKAEEVKITSLFEDLNSQKAQAMHERMVEGSLTIVQNNGILPLKKTADQKVAILTICTAKEKALQFQQAIKTYSDADFFVLPTNPDFESMRKTVAELIQYEVVIVNMMNTSNSPSKQFGLSQQAFNLALDINQETGVILNWFGNPYALKFMNGAEHFKALLIAYHDDKNTIETVARVMTGGANATGTLPVGVNNRYPRGLGYPLKASHQLRRTYPEYLGIASEDLDLIDSIVNNGIKEQAFPGCRVLVSKDGNVFLDRSYGHLTYEEKSPVNQATVYDLASITKVVATTAAIMRLVDEGKVNIEYNLCDYLDLADTSTHFQIKLKEMLSHKAQLKAWIPFYYETLDKGKLKKDIYRKTKSEEFNLMVAKGIYMRNTYVDSMYKAIEKSGLRSREGYKYSDLGYYYLKKIVEKVSGTTLNNYVDSVFYKPMGLQSMGYYPLSHLPITNIAPTEYDAVFRKQLIHGYVHDPGAAMIGGVGGHAGVFSNGFDLMAMMDMFMNDGNYQGKNYLSKEVLEYFTMCHYCEEDIRRGIGFDKPALQPGTGPTSEEAPASSFGHSGFTGTLTWADPENGLIYVFLSNRVYPNAENRKLLKMNIRTDIQAAIYRALKNAEERNSMQVFPEWNTQQ
ncbi:MAG: serine hydrolase, partial [Flavobacteriales bacterium]